MCVIYVCRTAIPPLEELAAGAMNDDGAGVAWVDVINGKPRVRWKKGLKDENAVHEVVKDLKPPVMIHFRLATIGGDTPLLTHPFPLTERAPLELEGNTVAVLAHNGHWHKWDDTLKDLCARSGKLLPAGPWSDSRAMAWIAANFGVGMLNLTAEYQKIAVLHAVKGFHILNATSWLEKSGWLQSSSTMTRRYKSTMGWHGLHDDVYSGTSDDWRGGITLGRQFPSPFAKTTERTDGVSFYKAHDRKSVMEKVIKPIQITLGGAHVVPKVHERALLSSAPPPMIVGAEGGPAQPVIPKPIVLGPDDISQEEMSFYLRELMNPSARVGHA